MNTVKPLILVGFMGVGKTTLGRFLSRRLGWSFVESDEHIAAQEGLSAAALINQKGELYFRECELAFVRNFKAASPCIVSCGGGLPCFPGRMDHLLELGCVVYLRARIQTLIQRLKPTDFSARPLLRGKLDPQHLETLLKQREPYYGQASITVQTDGLSVEAIADVVQALIEQFISLRSKIGLFEGM